MNKVVSKIHELLAKDGRKQFIFYFDENAGDRSFDASLKAIEEADIKVVTAKDNYFELKYKLEMEWFGNPVFIYHPFVKPTRYEELKEYPLLDLLIANTELKLDDVSEFIAEFALPQSERNLVKQYIKVLRLPSYQRRLSRILEKGQFHEDNLKRGLISIILGFSSVVSKSLCMAKAFEVALDKEEFEKVVARLRDLALEEKVLAWFNNIYDTNATDLTHSDMIKWASKLDRKSVV